MEIELVVNSFKGIAFLPVTFLGVLTLPFVEPGSRIRRKRQNVGYDISVCIRFVWDSNEPFDYLRSCRFYVEGRLFVAPRLLVLIVGHHEQQAVYETV